MEAQRSHSSPSYIFQVLQRVDNAAATWGKKAKHDLKVDEIDKDMVYVYEQSGTQLETRASRLPVVCVFGKSCCSICILICMYIIVHRVCIRFHGPKTTFGPTQPSALPLKT